MKFLQKFLLIRIQATVIMGDIGYGDEIGSDDGSSE